MSNIGLLLTFKFFYEVWQYNTATDDDDLKLVL